MGVRLDGGLRKLRSVELDFRGTPGFASVTVSEPPLPKMTTLQDTAGLQLQ